MKPPNATFYGGRGHTRTSFPFSIGTWVKPLRIQLLEKSPTFNELSASSQIDAIKFERTQIHFFNAFFTAVVVVVATRSAMVLVTKDSFGFTRHEFE